MRSSSIRVALNLETDVLKKGRKRKDKETYSAEIQVKMKADEAECGGPLL